MPPAPPQQQGQSDNSLAPLWIVIGIFVLLYAIWFFLKAEIYQAFTMLKLWEIDVISLFTPALNGVKESMLAINPAHVTFMEMVGYANQIGFYISVPCGIVLVILALLLYRKGKRFRFKRTYSMKTLLASGNKNWPQTTPVIGQDLVKIDIEEGPWAMAQTPMQFAKKHQLLKVVDTPADDTKLSREVNVTVVVIKSKAIQLFVKQMGPLWRGVDALNIHTKALFAIFAARLGDDHEGAEKLIYQIATSASNKRLDFSGVAALLNKHKDQKIIRRLTSEHAYVLTVMPSILSLARTTGVIASADFLWLKIIDRRLWFVLNAIGRQTPSIEAAGPFAHWLLEKELGRKIQTPMIDEAVKALEDAISMVIYTPDEEE